MTVPNVSVVVDPGSNAANGTIRRITDVAAMDEFLEEHGAAIAAHVSDNYPARYTAREMAPARGMSPASPRAPFVSRQGDAGDFGDLRAQWQRFNALRPTKRLAELRARQPVG